MKRSNKIVTKAIILFVMTWIMILGAVSSKRLTVYASTYYSGYLVTNSDTAQTLQEKVVRFNGMDWYIIADNSTAVDAGTVTLFAKDKIANSKFNNSCGSGNYYCSSAIKSFLDNLTSGNGSFGGVSYVIADTDLEDVYVTGAKLWLLSTSEAEALNSNARKCSSNWWLRSPSPLSSSDDLKKAMFVDGQNGGMPGGYSGLPYVDMSLGVRPALNLKLTDVTFNQETKTFIPLLPALNPIENKTYNGNAQEPTITFESVNLTKDTDYTVSYEDSQGNVVTAPTNADTYTVTVTGIGNYSGTRTTSYTIEKECPTITAPIPNTLIYTGSAQDLVTAGQTSFGTMVYSLDGTSYSEAIPVGTDVGTYYVWYMVVGDENHCDTTPVCVTVTIAAPRFSSAALELDGILNMRYYVTYPEGWDTTGDKVVFTVNGGAARTVTYANSKTDSNGRYFVCPVKAFQMADPITAVYYHGGAEVARKENYSVKQNLENLSNTVQDQTTLDFIHAIMDFGHYIQPFLAPNNNWTVGEDHVEMPAYDSNLTAMSSADNQYAHQWVKNDEYVQGGMFSLYLEADTQLRVLVKLKDMTGTVTDPVVTGTINGEDVTPELVNIDGVGEGYMLTLRNIPSNALVTSYTFTLSVNGTEVSNLTISALSYINIMLGKGDNVQDLALTALYNYAQAAHAYETYETN